jgi:NitT/TauT family transport system permease protein
MTLSNVLAYPAAARGGEGAEPPPAPGPIRLLEQPPAEAGASGGVGRRRLNWRRLGIAYGLGVLSLALSLLVWHLATKYKIEFYVRFKNVPSPEIVFDRLMTAFENKTYVVNILKSLQRILLGFCGAALLGVTLGLLMGWYRPLRQFVMPTLEVLRPIPAIAWVPMAIMLWPTAESSMVYITFLGAFFPILLNTIHGVSTIEPVLIRAASSLGAGQATLFTQVMLPATLPHIFTGLAVGMGVAWVSLIAAEMISGQFGIGYFTWEAYSLVQYPDIVVGMVSIGVLGLLCSGAIRLIGNSMMPWQRLADRSGK